HAAFKLGALAGIKRGHALGPVGVRALRSAAGLAPSGENVWRDFERRMRPAKLLARAFDFVGAERRAMRRRFTGLGRRTEADSGLAGDQHWTVGALRLLQRRRKRFRIVTVDARGGPAGGLEALHLNDAVGQRQRAVD